MSKRKSLHNSDHSSCEVSPIQKNRKFETTTSYYKGEAGSGEQSVPEISWKEYFGDWPPKQNTSIRQSRAAQRCHTPSRSNSYSQRVRDEDSPVAWTRKHEERMEEVGLFMTADRTQANITSECQQLCDTLLDAEYSLPESPAYQQDRLSKVLRRVRFRNKARVVRDVMPILVPSPELLHIDGHAELDNICEAMNEEWTHCDTLYGSKPKPDFVGGISAFSFTTQERQKLQMNHTSACPNLFPENMYFPFLICEAGGSDRPLEEAERQAMHSASIATRAVVELFRKVSATAEVHQRILAFSVAHNHSMVVIYVHFATIDCEKTSFFRRLLYHNLFVEDLDCTAWMKAYKIIRAIYEHFVPQHVDRIRSALSRMRSPALASFATQLGVDEESQTSTPEQFSSQEDGRFRKTSLSSVMRLEKENEDLRDMLMEWSREQQTWSNRRREDQHEQRAMTEKQLAQGKEEFQTHKVMIEKQLAQGKEEFQTHKVMMEKQLAQEKEDFQTQMVMMEKQLAQEKEEFQTQMVMMEKQLAQQQEIIKLLTVSEAA